MKAVLIALCALALAALACGTATREPATPTAWVVTATPAHQITSTQRTAPTAAPSGIEAGTIAAGFVRAAYLDDECNHECRFYTHSSGALIGIWPDGYTFSVDGERPIEAQADATYFAQVYGGIPQAVIDEEGRLMAAWTGDDLHGAALGYRIVLAPREQLLIMLVYYP